MTSWRPLSILHYQNYEVSDDGRVRRNGRQLAQNADRYGYCRVGLYHAGTRRTWKVHRLVCEAFHGKAPATGLEVRHIDGDRANNSAANLCWGTRAENTADSVRHGSFAFGAGEAHPRARLTAEQVAEIRSLKGTVSQRQLARQFGIGQPQVCHILQGKKWAA